MGTWHPGNDRGRVMQPEGGKPDLENLKNSDLCRGSIHTYTPATILRPPPAYPTATLGLPCPGLANLPPRQAGARPRPPQGRLAHCQPRPALTHEPRSVWPARARGGETDMKSGAQCSRDGCHCGLQAVRLPIGSGIGSVRHANPLIPLTPASSPVSPAWLPRADHQAGQCGALWPSRPRTRRG